MHWILENLQIVAALAAGIAYWLKQTRDKARAEREASAPPPLMASSASEEHVERTRRIQEEIRRKIAERRAGKVVPLSSPGIPSERPIASSTLAPRPVAGPVGGTLRERMEAKMAEALARIEDAAKAATPGEAERSQPTRPAEAVLAAREADRLAAERRAALEALAEREQMRRLAAIPSLSNLNQPEPTVGRSLRDDLRNPDSMRRAWILREVLGAPVGLR